MLKKSSPCSAAAFISLSMVSWVLYSPSSGTLSGYCGLQSFPRLSHLLGDCGHQPLKYSQPTQISFSSCAWRLSPMKNEHTATNNPRYILFIDKKLIFSHSY